SGGRRRLARMRITKRRLLVARLPWLLVALATAAFDCNSVPTTELVDLDRRWHYEQYPGGGDHRVPVTSDQEHAEGVVSDSYVCGQTFTGGPATGDVYSSESGETYWVQAIAPIQQTPADPRGSVTTLKQDQYFKKLVPGASLTVSLTKMFFEG